MPVFDFSNMQAKKEPVRCTYAMVYSDNDHASPENPILVIDNQKREWKHHSFGIFANPNKQTTFEFEEEDGTISADILKVDARFVSLLKWLGLHSPIQSRLGIVRIRLLGWYILSCLLDYFPWRAYIHIA